MTDPTNIGAPGSMRREKVILFNLACGAALVLDVWLVVSYGLWVALLGAAMFVLGIVGWAACRWLEADDEAGGKQSGENKTD